MGESWCCGFTNINVAQYTKKIDGAFVGALERTSMVFLDEKNPNTLHTVLTIRVSEWLFGDIPQKGASRIEVLMHGGTYIETNGKRVPKRPAEFAEGLVIGSEYFVPIEIGDKFGKERAGRLMVDGIAMSRLDASGVAPVVRNTRWASDAIAKAEAAQTSVTPGPAPSAREIFLIAIRTAGRENRERR